MRSGPTPGERFGHYDILAPLGAGGMGVVFRAKDTRLGREVALKTLPPENVTDPTRLQRFEAEARAASALNHPNVLAVFDVGREGETPYLVTELLIGETLRERLKSGTLPPRKVIELGVQVAQGLAAVHEKGIVHRDLKPENLFLTKDGLLKILDFGVARTLEGAAFHGSPQVEPPTGTLPLTQEGAVMGTAGYMSPEQVRGRPADARSDLFALGAILSECLSGAMAFPGETPVERGYAILNTDPAPITVGAPPALIRVIHRCLEKDPAQRFQHARDLHFALEAITDGSGQTPLQGVPAAPRWPTVAIVALALSVVAATFAVWQSQQPREWNPPNPPSGGPLVPTPPMPPSAVANVARAATGAPALPRAVSKRVSYRNGTIVNARFTSDGRGVTYAGAFEHSPLKVFSGVLDGPEIRPASGPATLLFDVSAKDELALGQWSEDTMQKGSGMVLSRGSLAGGAARPLYENILWADFGPGDLMVLSRIVDSKFVIECPPGNVIASSSEALSRARLSPDGKYVAYMRQPVVGDDRGTVEIVDRTGRPIAKSQAAWTLDGIAWSADGKEVWFSAGYDDVARRLYALSLEGVQREIFSAPGSLRIFDVDSKGRVLAVAGITRSRMFGKMNGDATERSLSWLDGSMPLDVSSDGKALLFLEGFGPASTEVQTWLRRFDQEDDTPMLLGLGWGRALSPDRRWAIVSPKAPFNTLRLVPTGAGSERDLPAGDFQAITHVRFFPDGQRIAFGALDRENVPHIYVQSVADARDQPGLTLEPVRVGDDAYSLLAAPSPDGKWLVGYQSKTHKSSLIPVDPATGPIRTLDALPNGDFPIQWTPDAKKLWVWRRPKGVKAALRVELLQFDLTNGKEVSVNTIGPADPVGMEHIKGGIVTPDGASYVYTVNQQLDELYLIEGVR
ncbi:MAG: serine/threonine-protein kinase [Archangium sp.]|nr:serine/threonine-protein kinase [Archangium sp.]